MATQMATGTVGGRGKSVVRAVRVASAGVASVGRSRPSRRHRGGGPSVSEALLLLDLLAAGTAAGLSAGMALRRSVEVLDGAFGERLRLAVAQSELAIDRNAPLMLAAEEAGFPELVRAFAALGRSATLGTPLSEQLASIAARARRGRARAAMRRARTAPVRLLFPLVLLVLPAFVLLTVVPMLLLTLGSIL